MLSRKGTAQRVKQKIVFFTPRSVQPLHPRLVTFEKFFVERGVTPVFINASVSAISFFARVRNWLVLWFFDLYAVSVCKKALDDYQVIFVTDLKYLPLARYAKKKGKIVIYDTIDHNVHLRFYQLQQKLPWIKPLKNLIINTFIILEKRLVKKYCDAVLVNSMSLNDYFDRKAITLFYSSPFEKFSVDNIPDNPPALLYLGGFSYEKGANEVLYLQQSLKIPLYIFGPVSDVKLYETLRKRENVYYSKKLSVAQLEESLVPLFRRYFLFGLSLIRPVHYSYEVQEANKDIDYLALGVPLIGNGRLLTHEKITAGCGVFYNDPDLVKKINDTEFCRAMNNQSRSYYQKNYASYNFYKNLEQVLVKLKVISE